MAINSTLPLTFWITEIADGIKVSSTAALVLTVVTLAVISFVVAAQFERKKYPPGPSRLDVAYGLLFNAGKFIKYRAKWRRRFGSVYTIFFGRHKRIVLTDYDTIHDAFVRHADVCSSRPREHGMFFAGSEVGFGSTHYRELRRFALTVLREKGMGKIDMEFKIMEEIRSYINVIEQHVDEPLDLNGHIHRAVSNIICNLVLGSRFDYSDPVFISIVDRFQNHVKYFIKMSAIAGLPLLQWLPGDIFGYHRYVRDTERNKSFFREAIIKHKENLDPESPRDYIDAYLLEMKARENLASTDASAFNEANCISTVVSLFLAGTDTTANTLLWAWLFIILHIDVQKKVQSEIDAVIGSRYPSLSDKAQMPYTEAVLTEVMRLANTSISALPHQAEKTISIDGHSILSDTILSASLSDVHLDEQTYPEPMSFKPERFIGLNGKFEKPKKFIPFGLGRRVCIGESLARAELFLFFTSVLQKFDLTSPQGSRYKAEGECGLVHKPLPYKIVFKRRQRN